MGHIATTIAALLGNEGFCRSLFRIIGFLGVAWSMIRFIYTRNVKEMFSWFGIFVVMTSFVYTAKITIRVKDEVSKYERVIENVPWIWGYPAYLLNQLSTEMAKRMDQVFTILPSTSDGGLEGFNANYLPYYETGTVFASRLISKARHFRIMDPIFNGNLERFINQCVVFDALIGRKYTMKDLLETNDIWALAKDHASPVMGFSYKEGDQSEILSCRDGVVKLEAEWAKQFEEASKRYGKMFFPSVAGDASGQFMTHLPKAYTLLTNLPGDATKILQQSMMINALTRAPNQKLSELGSPINYGTTKTLLQQRSNFAIAGEVARDTLPIIKVVLEALTYASFIFVFFIALLPRGIRVLKTYFEMLLSIQLWPVLYSVLNGIMTIYARGQTRGMIQGEGINLINNTGIGEINADIAAYAGYWSMMIPILAYMVTKGGVSSMVQAAGSIGGAFMSASSAAAQELVSGNVSLGNFQYGTQSVLNTSNFKHDDTFMDRSNQMTMLQGNGMEVTHMGEGSVAFKAGQISHLGMRATNVDSLQKSATDALSHSEGLMKTTSEEWGMAKLQTAMSAVNAATMISESVQSGKAYDASTGFSMDQSMQNITDFSSTLQNKYGLSSSQSNEFTAGISVGKTIGELIATPSLGFNFKTEANRQEAYDEINALSEKYQLTDSLNKTIQTLERITFGENNVKEAKLAEEVSNSYQQQDSLREAYSKAKQEHDSLNNLVQAVRSGTLSVEWEDSQQLLDYVAEQSYQGHRIGYDMASRMIQQRDPIALTMIHGYQEQQWKKIDMAIQGSDHVLSLDELKGAYQNTTMPQTDLKGTFEREAEVLKDSTSIGKVDDSARIQHGEQQLSVQQSMDQKTSDMMDKRNKSSEANQRNTKRMITGKMISNTTGIDKAI